MKPKVGRNFTSEKGGEGVKGEGLFHSLAPFQAMLLSILEQFDLKVIMVTPPYTLILPGSLTILDLDFVCT